VGIRDEGYSKIVAAPPSRGLLGCLQAEGCRTSPTSIMPSLMPAVPKPDGQDPAANRRRGAGCANPFLGANLGRYRPAAHAPGHAGRLRWRTAKEGDKIMVRGPSARASTRWCFEGSPPRTPSWPQSARACRAGWPRRKEEKNYLKFLAFNEMLPIEKGALARPEVRQEDGACRSLWRQARHDLTGWSRQRARSAARCSFRGAKFASNSQTATPIDSQGALMAWPGWEAKT